eukprot:835457-Pelagomonas_calceolata.AAC.1
MKSMCLPERANPPHTYHRQANAPHTSQAGQRTPHVTGRPTHPASTVPTSPWRSRSEPVGAKMCGPHFMRSSRASGGRPNPTAAAYKVRASQMLGNAGWVMDGRALWTAPDALWQGVRRQAKASCCCLECMQAWKQGDAGWRAEPLGPNPCALAGRLQAGQSLLLLPGMHASMEIGR